MRTQHVTLFAVVVGGTMAAAALLMGAIKLLSDASVSFGDPHLEEPPLPSTHDDDDRFLVTTVATEDHGTWRIDRQLPRVCVVGTPCDVVFRLVPAPGWHANAVYPTRLIAENDGALTFATGTVDRKGDTILRKSSGIRFDDDDGSAEAHLVIIPRDAPREHHVVASLRISACNDDVCRLARHDISFSIDAVKQQNLRY